MICFGIELTNEDMARITASVGTMVVALSKDMRSREEMDEVAEMCKLHIKLVKGMEEMHRMASK